MKRYASTLIVSFVVVAAIYSIGATHATSPPGAASLSGKFVIVSQTGMYHGVSKNARFETVGRHDYIVIPAQHPEIKDAYDYWIPLRDVVDLKVFGSRKDAYAFEKSTSPFRDREVSKK